MRGIVGSIALSLLVVSVAVSPASARTQDDATASEPVRARTLGERWSALSPGMKITVVGIGITAAGMAIMIGAVAAAPAAAAVTAAGIAQGVTFTGIGTGLAGQVIHVLSKRGAPDVGVLGANVGRPASTTLPHAPARVPGNPAAAGAGQRR